MTLTCAILSACLLDLLLGDPACIPHPVVWMGRCIQRMETFLRKHLPATKNGELAGGAILALLLPVFVFLISFGICRLCARIHPVCGFLPEVFWCFQALAARSLAREAGEVQKRLTGEVQNKRPRIPGEVQKKLPPVEESRGTKDLEAARAQVSRIVGRDTARLDRAGVIRACVETVAENSSDGVIAPLFFMLMGGAPLALAYKAVNTMDSMIGYRNDRYLYFGRAAARLDDAANFIPARVAALLWIAAASLIKGTDGHHAWKIFLRDRGKHASPNAGQTESACAGALHVRLAGPASYFGKRVEKPWIGDDDRRIEPEDISRSVALMWTASILMLAAGILLRLLFCL